MAKGVIGKYGKCQAVLLLALVMAALLLLLLANSGLYAVGRDARPILLLCGVALMMAGALSSYLIDGRWHWQLGVLAPWMVVLYLLVAFALGVVWPDAIFMGWYLATAAGMVLPWLVGTFVARRLYRIMHPLL